MNCSIAPENLTIDTTQYTPVYLIQNNSITEARSYVIAPSNHDNRRSTCNNLKTFYENSGKIETNLLVNNVQRSPNIKPAILQKRAPDHVGNNLKLASFLVPSDDKQFFVTNKIFDNVTRSKSANVVSSVLPTANTTIVTTANIVPTNNYKIDDINNYNANKLVTTTDFVPQVVTKDNGQKNITKLKKVRPPQTLLKPKILPKCVPKEQVPDTANHTSVHLLKIKGAYHSLDKLTDDQMKLVNKALQEIGDPTTSVKASYDPISNTKIIYKIVAPKDLKVVGNKKIIVEEDKCKMIEIQKKEDKREEQQIKNNFKNNKIFDRQLPDLDEEPEPLVEVKVTRSGRMVKIPKHISGINGVTSSKVRKKQTATCPQCNAEFHSQIRLQRHLERHKGNGSIQSVTHANLFHCLLMMINNGTSEDKASIFIKQLEQLIVKLKNVLPCLLKKIDGVEGQACTINDDIGRLFGMNPGKYNLNIDALDCIKDVNGHCVHDPPPAPPPLPRTNQFTSDLSKPSQMWLSKHQEETANKESDTEDCARIKPVDSWPGLKRIWNQHLSNDYNEQKKKIKPNDAPEPLIELGIENMDIPSNIITLTDDDVDLRKTDNPEQNIPLINGTKKSQIQFHSAHFDIRSSPIKSSSTIFNKFQIVPEKLPSKYETTLFKPMSFLQSEHDDIKGDPTPLQNNSSDLNMNISENSLDLQIMLKELSTNNHNTSLPLDDNVAIDSKETEDLNNLSFVTSKEWPLNSSNDDNSNETYLKSSNLIKPEMLHVRDIINNVNNGTDYNTTDYNSSIVNNDSLINNNRMNLNQGQSVLNFLDSLGNDCLSCPEAEMRNNPIDFQLDLFSFNNN